MKTVIVGQWRCTSSSFAQGETLRVSLLQSTPAAFHGRPELAEQLTRELTTVLQAGHVVVA